MGYGTLEAKRRAANIFQRRKSGAKDPTGEDNRGPCQICGRVPGLADKGNAYDHDHSTGEFRGWLCFDCNTGLGKFKDSPALLQKAVDYLGRAD
jgi:hypothetical protein